MTDQVQQPAQQPTLADHLAAQAAIYEGMSKFVELYNAFVAANINPAQIPSPLGLVAQQPAIPAQAVEASPAEQVVEQASAPAEEASAS